jgi:hypothetical protein
VGEDAPVNGLKSLQVLVSRTRSACGGEVIVREGAGEAAPHATGELGQRLVCSLLQAELR